MNEHVQTTTTEPLFNPLSPEFIRDPYPHYERLRTTDPMHLTPFGAFVASRHAEASLVLRDRRFGKDFVERTSRRYGPKILEEPVFRSMSHWMLQQDPPDHTRLRGLVVKAFTAEESRRGLDHTVGAGRRRRQQALQRGADRQYHSVVRSRSRDHRQPDRKRAVGAAPKSRSARLAQGKSGAH